MQGKGWTHREPLLLWQKACTLGSMFTVYLPQAGPGEALVKPSLALISAAAHRCFSSWEREPGGAVPQPSRGGSLGTDGDLRPLPAYIQVPTTFWLGRPRAGNLTLSASSPQLQSLILVNRSLNPGLCPVCPSELPSAKMSPWSWTSTTIRGNAACPWTGHTSSLKQKKKLMPWPL